MASETCVISRVGRDGDGIAMASTGQIFIPDALPGETFTADHTGGWRRSAPTSSERVAPPCPHFGICGGCVAQHMSAPFYRDWKLGLITGAFRQFSFDVTPSLFVVPPGSRRRAALTAIVRPPTVELGFHARRSHQVIDLATCPVMADPIPAAFSALREIARHIAMDATSRAPIELRIEVADLAGGLDVSIHGSTQVPTMQSSAQLAVLSRRAGFARLTVNGVTVCAERTPLLETEAGAITPPPGAFFQAAASAEQRMAALIVTGVGKAKRVADLYCGSGTFTLPLARKARVLAVDSDKAALAALASAARFAPGLKPIETRLRDLGDEPLSPLELAGVDAVVFDPPRAGAKTQCEMLAKSKVTTVVAVSCNPATLARDCRTLVDAGFTMGEVHGIDQFLWSTHVEAVVTLTRRKVGTLT